MRWRSRSPLPRRFIGRICAKWPKVSVGRIRSMGVSIEPGTIPLTRKLRLLNSAATATSRGAVEPGTGEG